MRLLLGNGKIGENAMRKTLPSSMQVNAAFHPAFFAGLQVGRPR